MIMPPGPTKRKLTFQTRVLRCFRKHKRMNSFRIARIAGLSSELEFKIRKQGWQLLKKRSLPRPLTSIDNYKFATFHTLILRCASEKEKRPSLDRLNVHRLKSREIR